ncbi:MAG: hypothetical protein JWM11_1694 [Planctomycetaceae bacterium]|nr:hypothetical protein [Planctomycetaceae bacterium]
MSNDHFPDEFLKTAVFRTESQFPLRFPCPRGKKRLSTEGRIVRPDNHVSIQCRQVSECARVIDIDSYFPDDVAHRPRLPGDPIDIKSQRHTRLRCGLVLTREQSGLDYSPTRTRRNGRVSAYWKDGRAADCTGLENRPVRKDSGGSNPPPSAHFLWGCRLISWQISISQTPFRAELSKASPSHEVMQPARQSLELGN